jgi:nicotinamidase-related amidase
MLILVDFFLDPGLSPKANAGRGVVNATVNMIKGFRKAGMKILWTNVRTLIPPFPTTFLPWIDEMAVGIR